MIFFQVSVIPKTPIFTRTGTDPRLGLRFSLRRASSKMMECCPAGHVGEALIVYCFQSDRVAQALLYSKEAKNMPKASFTLPNGTVVSIDGTPAEVRRLLEFYGGKPEKGKRAGQTHTAKSGHKKPSAEKKISPSRIAHIVNQIKSCPEAEDIEKNILEKTHEANRVLLPLYVIHEYMGNAFGITTIEISRVTAELGARVRVSRQAALRALVRSPASRYVLTDKARRRGIATRYTLDERGVQYMKNVIAGKQEEGAKEIINPPS